MASKSIRDLRRTLEPTVWNLACRLFNVDPRLSHGSRYEAKIEEEAAMAALFHVTTRYAVLRHLDWNAAWLEVSKTIEIRTHLDKTIPELHQLAVKLALTP